MNVSKCYRMRVEFVNAESVEREKGMEDLRKHVLENDEAPMKEGVNNCRYGEAPKRKRLPLRPGT